MELNCLMTTQRIQKYIRLFVLLFISLISLVAYALIAKLPLEELIKTIAISVFATGLVMCVYEYIYVSRGDKYFEEIIGKKIPIYLKMKERGIENISDSFELDTYQDKIINSKKLTVVMNDGKSFISANSAIFKKRLNIPGKETNLVLLDPRSEFINLLNRKNGKSDSEYYQRKLINIFDEIFQDYEVHEKHDFKIYIHSMFNTMSVIIFDDIAMISLYRLSPGKSIVPHFEFKNTGEGSEYSEVVSDVNKLLSNQDIVDIINKENISKLKNDVNKIINKDKSNSLA